MLDELNIAERRYKTYDLLSYAFMNEPDEKLLAALEELGKLFNDLIEEDINFTKNKGLEDLKQEFYDRFFVNSSSLYVPPFEAAIRNMSVGENKRVKYGKLDSKETFHVKSCYMMVDFEPNKLNMFQPLRNNHFYDNLAFELAFMAFLTNNEYISLINGDEQVAKDWRNLQKEFLKEHLSTWIGDYAKLAEEKGKGLYSYLSNMSSIWIDLDYEYIFE